MSFFELWAQMGWLAKAIFILIVLIGAYSVSVMVERWVAGRSKSKQPPMDKDKE